jgi:uncharacterized protein (TIGR03067 family)
MAGLLTVTACTIAHRAGHAAAQNTGDNARSVHRISVLLATPVPVAAALAAPDEKLDGDLKKLQGKWIAKGDNGDSTYTFEGRKLKLVAPNRTYEMTITLDPNAKPEKTIDLKIDSGPDDAKGNTSKGIYKFVGDDKFIFCFSPMGERPEKYEQMGYEQIVTELTREK